MTQHICDSEFPYCPSDARSGDFYKLRLKDLSPTQFAVGKAEVHVRNGRLRKKHKKDTHKLHDYLRDRPVPIMVRGKRFLLVLKALEPAIPVAGDVTRQRLPCTERKLPCESAVAQNAGL
jgi:hypothetical protein